MKLCRGLLPFLCILGYTPCLLAQTPAQDSLAPTRIRPVENYRKNILKFNASSLILHNYSFSYERSLTRKISFVAGYRFMPKTVLGDITLVKHIINDLIADDFDGKNDLDKISTSNNTFTGEFRFYTGRKPGARGFYLSLYGRYSHLTIDYAYDYTTNTTTYSIPLHSTSNVWGAGLMIGAQWLIAKRVTLDWYILGAQYGTVKGNASGAEDLSMMSQFDRDELKSDIENIFDISDKRKYITATVTSQGVTAKIDGPMIGLRAAGISIGIAF